MFEGRLDFCSNFYPAPIVWDDPTGGPIVYPMKFPTSEHAYAAAKAEYLEDARLIAGAVSPGQAKKLGRKIALRRDWEAIKIEVMRSVLKAKFEQHPDLMKRLLETGDEELVEVNNWGDKFWGVCNGNGLNWLGFLLMEIRGK